MQEFFVLRKLMILNASFVEFIVDLIKKPKQGRVYARFLTQHSHYLMIASAILFRVVARPMRPVAHEPSERPHAFIGSIHEFAFFIVSLLIFLYIFCDPRSMGKVGLLY